MLEEKQPKSTPPPKKGIMDFLNLSGSETFPLITKFRVVVPQDYCEEQYIDKFGEKHRRNFRHYKEWLTSNNFPRPSTRLIPGKTYGVALFGITRVVTTEQCIAHYDAVKALYTGVHGNALTYEQRWDVFPRGKYLISFDKKETSLKQEHYTESQGYRYWVSFIHKGPSGPDFWVNCREGAWHWDYCLVCFFE